ncbi:hypothetical protein OA544_02635 [Candidatus Pelagibacter sp.]|nr:hypothetical protein [Candidatus Pelagibacter sp.]
MKNTYLKKFIKILYIEKYIFLVIAVVVYSSYTLISERFDGSAVKGRFIVNIGKYHTIDFKKGFQLTPIEEPNKLFSYLESYEFFESIDQKKCKIDMVDISRRNYIVRLNDIYVEIILRFNDRKHVLNCLDIIRKKIEERHVALFKNYIDTINFQIETLKSILKTNQTELPTERLQNSSLMEMQQNITPLILHRNSLLKTYRSTSFLNQRTYPVQSVYYGNVKIGIILCSLISVSLFIVYIFIKHRKQLDF